MYIKASSLSKSQHSQLDNPIISSPDTAVLLKSFPLFSFITGKDARNSAVCTPQPGAPRSRAGDSRLPRKPEAQRSAERSGTDRQPAVPRAAARTARTASAEPRRPEPSPAPRSAPGRAAPPAASPAPYLSGAAGSGAQRYAARRRWREKKATEALLAARGTENGGRQRPAGQHRRPQRARPQQAEHRGTGGRAGARTWQSEQPGLRQRAPSSLKGQQPG